ncbi:MAG: hypothetical protein A2315_06850 [Ignavibacteria bacterium RIFOXYB2_FULL_35_12]|nr:MAG: hypothetical protein A2058_08235 [Ignavibacteria bacterium GWA2_36_19]OGU51806.1 MAG: hypothetical protein A2006_07375 [Ignavibacteria bacterium GWC2_35_8]OGU62737.1 MAG: hypothetical protein A2X60_05025 [Ignavibacteria bacterium GWF2_35_20]OGU81565.1 MAG: hypothetical protein A2254_01275 [Ignavibacteria bacterium RIFOXYA2_FULL_35_9]OGU85708.1 MAG: hypothetical protein A3K31_05410 [Ignavibacteria bacterium RIFOXYA12_FULL_35_25]OGU89509.1 MAG: hypothetical protein A2492_10960 [Ignavibac
MDIFKQNRYLFIVIILLVILNLAMLTMLWIGKPERHAPQLNPPNPIEEQNRIRQLLKDELNFDNQQTEQYLRIHQEHREKMRKLNDEIRKLKKQMFDEVLKDVAKPELSDSLLTISQNKQAEIEQLTFQHFLDLKKLCKPEQQNKLKLLIHELFRGQHAGNAENQPPPPPNNRRPPKEPREKQ